MVNKEIKKALNSISAEWLEATGTGGFAFSTSHFVNTRRYHGLLVAGEGADDTRAVLLSRLDERAECSPGVVSLGTHLFADSCQPQGYRFVSGICNELFPEVTFTLPGGIQIRKAIVAVHGENTVLIRYQIEGSPSLKLELEPFCALRQYHSLQLGRVEQMSVFFSDGHLSVQNNSNGLEVHLSAARSEYQKRDEWHQGVYYPEEEARGYDAYEDLYLPGVLKVVLEVDAPYFVAISDKALNDLDIDILWQQEISRRKELLLPYSSDVELGRLARAADQFLVRDNSGALDIVAGYPWFTCWARDTMISLPGLCLVTGRFQEGREILQHWATALSEGMLPNRLGVEPIEYNTVDGTLWFVVACYRYLTTTKDPGFLTEDLWFKLISIIDHHIDGTRYKIKMDPEDGLISAGTRETQLTWMDACYNDIPVTPRWGKAVEINALWFNVLKIAAEFAREKLDIENQGRFEALAARVKESFFKVFWDDGRGYLADWVRGETVCYQLRPNQLFALSLPFPLVENAEAKQVIDLLRKTLLTPFGLRTLSFEDEEYIGRYSGGLLERDRAYHQGTVWPWLLGAYASAVLTFEGEGGRIEIESLFNNALSLLEVGALGSVSEVFDGSAPHNPGGCPAQAWSVAALLEVARSLGLV